MPSGAGAIGIVVVGGILVSAIFSLFRDFFSTPARLSDFAKIDEL